MTAVIAQDAAILAAWERYRVARSNYDALPFSDCPNGSYTPAEREQINAMDAAEKELQASVAETPQGIEPVLWLALMQMVSSRSDEGAALRTDLSYFLDNETAHDWNVRLIVAAIRSLRKMGGAA